MTFDLKTFNYRPHTIKKSLDKYVHGQESLKKTLSVAFWQHYSRLKERLENPIDPLTPSNKPNVLIVGQSGTGKTITPRTLCKLIGVPYLYVDSTDFSEAGYIGENVSDIPRLLYEEAGRNKYLSELAVIHIDEIDKKASRGNDFDDVSRGSVLSSYLTLIEGKQAEVDTGVKIDTTNVLFIASGAFEEIVEIKRKRLKGSLGFGEKTLIKSELAEIDASIDDLEKYGINKQFLGRFSNITHTNEFGVVDLSNILALEKNPLIPDVINDFKNLGININVNENIYEMIANEAIKHKTGARSLAKTINDIFKEYFYVLGEREIKEIHIDENFLKNPQKSLHELVENSKFKDEQKLIQVSMSTGIDKKVVVKNFKYRSAYAYTKKLKSLGMDPNFIDVAGVAGFNEKIEPLKMFEKIEHYNNEVDNLEELFRSQFSRNLNVGENCREELINIGLKDSNGRKLLDLIYEPVWSKFEKNKDKIQNSKIKKIELLSVEDDNINDFFENLNKKKKDPKLGMPSFKKSEPKE